MGQSCHRGALSFAGYSRHDFQRRDLVPFQTEAEPKFHGAAGKVAGKPAGDHELSVLLFTRKQFTRVLILGRRFRLPLLDGGSAAVGMPLVLHDCVVREALGNRLAVLRVGSEIGGDGVWQIEIHDRPSVENSEHSLRRSLGQRWRPTVTLWAGFLSSSAARRATACSPT